MENNCPECQKIEDDKRCVYLFQIALEKSVYDLMVRTTESLEAKQVAQEELSEFITLNYFEEL